MNSDPRSPMNLLIHHREKIDSSHNATSLRCLNINLNIEKELCEIVQILLFSVSSPHIARIQIENTPCFCKRQGTTALSC